MVSGTIRTIGWAAIRVRVAGDVRPEDGVEVGLVVVEEAIGGGRLGVAAAGGRDAGGGVPGQVGEDELQSPVEPLVVEVGIRHLLGDPIGDALGWPWPS